MWIILKDSTKIYETNFYLIFKIQIILPTMC